MSDVFGIDLGTTYSAIAHINDDGLAEIIRNTDGIETTPSVVHFENPENSIVGETAKNATVVESEDIAQLIKRRMGSEYTVVYHGVQYTPEMISALVLKQLVQDANEQTGMDSKRVVITVPAYFGQLEREATAQAGDIAGLDVVGMVTEPVAAAMSYVASSNEDKTFLVYDLGGGTFDTTVLRTFNDSRPIEVMVIDGDRELGGADWDARLSDILTQKFLGATTLDEDPRDDDDFLQDLAEKAERAKQQLSSRMKCDVILAYGSTREKLEVTRQEFEDATNDLLNTTLETVDRTLNKAKEKDLTLTIDEVLLVGGSTRMPVVKRSLESRFPEWTFKLADPNLAVAKGAALYGVALEQQNLQGEPSSDPDSTARTRYLASSATIVKNVLSRGLGVLFVKKDSGEPYVDFIAEQNESLPIENRHVEAATFGNNATSIAIKVFEQGGIEKSASPEDSREITPEHGAVFTNLPSLPEGSPIDIYLTIDNEGLATMKALEPKSQQELHLEVTISVMQPQEVRLARDVVSRITTRG